MTKPEADQSTPSKAGPAILVLIGVVLAAATVYAVKTSYVLRYELKQKEDELQKLRAADIDAAEVVSLQKRLQDTDGELNRLRDENTRLKQSPPPLAATAAPVPPPTVPVSNAAPARSTNRVAWLERTRQEDPERYKQLTEARGQRRQQVEAALQEQFTRLDERLQTAPTQEEADLVTEISKTMGQLVEMRERWRALQELPEEERRAEGQTLWAEGSQLYQTLTNLRTRDRDMQLQQLASQLGYNDAKDIAGFVESVQRINKETDTGMRRFFGRGRGDGGGPQQ